MNRIGDAELSYLREVLDGEFRGQSMSKMNARFEAAFAERFGMRFAISHTSGTATLHSALAAAGVEAGDEVIVPPLTMASTTLAVLYESAIPVFVDIDPNTYTLDPQRLEEAITEKTKAIIPVAVYGLSPDFDPIMEIAERHGLTVIEDDAECYLGFYKGRVVGSLGHLSSFSLQGSKHITAGEGGVVCTNDEALADKVRQFAIVGYDVVRAKSGEINRDAIQSPDFIRHTSLGYKYKMSDLCAAVALGQLERIEQHVRVRQTCAAAYDQVLQGCDWIQPQFVGPDYVNSYYTYAARLDLAAIDFSWHDFRNKFIELGGDGFYAAWRLTYNEPMWSCDDFRVRNVVTQTRFDDGFSGYWRERCPHAERVQPELIQLKTNYYDDKRLEQQVEIFSQTIEFFNS